MTPASAGQPLLSVLVVIGLLATLWLLWRRDLWCGTVRRLPPERWLGLEAFARSLLGQPPTRQVQVRQLGDLQLGVCRQGGGHHGNTIPWCPTASWCLWSAEPCSASALR